jgi:hypothetical protein
MASGSFTTSRMKPSPPGSRWACRVSSLGQHTATKIPSMYSFYGNCAGLSHNFHNHVSVWAIYIFPGSVHIYFPQQNMQIDCRNIQIDHRDMNAEIGTVAEQFLCWEYIFFNWRSWFFAKQLFNKSQRASYSLSWRDITKRRILREYKKPKAFCTTKEEWEPFVS